MCRVDGVALETAPCHLVTDPFDMRLVRCAFMVEVCSFIFCRLVISDRGVLDACETVLCFGCMNGDRERAVATCVGTVSAWLHEWRQGEGKEGR